MTPENEAMALANNPFTQGELKDFPIDIPKNAPPRLVAPLFENLEENQIRALFIRNKVEGTFALANFITKKYDILTIGETKLEFFVYRAGQYREALNEIIFPEVQKVLGALTTQGAKMETMGKIAGQTMHPRSVFASVPLNLIPLTNGVYDRDTKTLLPHDPSYRFSYQLPIIYDPDAICHRTSAFLDEILDVEQRQIVEEWIGYYFLRSYWFKRAIIFVGEGDTGKTTLLEVIDYLLGKENLSSITLQKMAGDKFAAAHLYGKHGNLVDELSARDISDTGNFKIATGGGSISGERKYGNQFSFLNFSKLTFATNKIPDVKDFDDDAYFNRWIVIRFDNLIAKKIPNFISTLATPAERSGLFNLAMCGLDRLIAQGGFSYAKTPLDTKREMMRSGSSIAAFAAECLTQENGAEITKEDLYDVYSRYCADQGIAAETIKMLGTKMPYYVPYAADGFITTTNSLLGKARPRGWRNVKVRDVQVVDAATQEMLDNF